MEMNDAECMTLKALQALLYQVFMRKPQYFQRLNFGAPERNRTPSLPLRRGTLYPVELRALIEFASVAIYWLASIGCFMLRRV